MKRIFLALPVGENNQAELELLKQRHGAIESLRWTRRENYHVTIYFIGNVEEYTVERIRPKLWEALGVMAPFRLVPDRIAPYPSAKPAMIWAHFHKNESFRLIYEVCRQALQDLGIQGASHDDPIPHITLARIKSNRLLFPDPGTIKLHPIAADHCELWESLKTTEGVLYKCLDTFRFHS